MQLTNIMGNEIISNNKPGVIIIEGHVQGLANTRALGKAGIPVVVIDVRKCVAASSCYCKQFFLCPDFTGEDFVPFLLELVKDHELKDWMLLPSNDLIVHQIAKHRNILSSYFKLITPELPIVEQICDKTALLKIAENLALPTPKTVCFKSTEDEAPIDFKFPLLTKGKEGFKFYKALKTKAYLSDNAQALNKNLAKIGDNYDISQTFTQELIPFDGTNKTLSFAAFCIDGEIKAHWMGVKLREHPLQFGTATLTESVFDQSCLDYSIILLKELKYTGICEVEYLMDPRDRLYKLIEINPRTWLWVGHAIACGINFPLYAYNYLNNIPNEYPNEYILGLKWKNIYSDSMYSLIGIVKKHIAIKDWYLQNKGTKVSALWDEKDKKPFFTYGRLMFNFLKNR